MRDFYQHIRLTFSFFHRPLIKTHLWKSLMSIEQEFQSKYEHFSTDIITKLLCFMCMQTTGQWHCLFKVISIYISHAKTLGGKFVCHGFCAPVCVWTSRKREEYDYVRFGTTGRYYGGASEHNELLKKCHSLHPNIGGADRCYVYPASAEEIFLMNNRNHRNDHQTTSQNFFV